MNKYLHAPTHALNQTETDRGEMQALVTRVFNLHREQH